ncbi:rhodanese-like domain-containing protein [Novosphingobium sp. 1949]|uniref:Rhodanese-like domain-containing protein n=1 Tax=Novosphingobium organovorum TaxID=2930092 RepID=A0ABT0BC13_9SPHN|nr:rhodanese-like domain-containing protein [Novosphingobium organovorum]MCJ2182514.1 rhodanese-like domain-containing protein [Novosphingobium organovorum]
MNGERAAGAITGVESLIAAAMERIETLDVATAIARRAKGDALFVDLREAHELAASGRIPGAVHVPRGTLEFRVDPNSGFYLEHFEPGRPLILFCQLAARSALAVATLQDMGLPRVSHIAGGFAAWREAGGPVDPA